MGSGGKEQGTEYRHSLPFGLTCEFLELLASDGAGCLVLMLLAVYTSTVMR